MKSVVRFHHGDVQLASEDVVQYLRATSHCSLHQLIDHLYPDFHQLSGMQRISLWLATRQLLQKMERQGVLACQLKNLENVWRLA